MTQPRRFAAALLMALSFALMPAVGSAVTYESDSLREAGARAGRGLLTDGERDDLRRIAKDHPNFTIAWAVLMTDGEARRDYDAHCVATEQILSLSKNQQHPEYNLEAAKCKMRTGLLEEAIGHAEVTLSHTADMNPRSRNARLLLAQEIRARCAVKLFDDDTVANGGTSEAPMLRRSITAWRAYQAFAVEIGNGAAVAKAAQELGALEARDVPSDPISTTLNTPDPAGFRAVRWGASVAEVKKREGATPADEKDGRLAYDETLAGLECHAMYCFQAGRLYIGGYNIVESHTDPQAHVADYQRLKGLLAEKYGLPASDEVVWRNELWRDNPSAHGVALSAGHVSYEAHWLFETSIVRITLSGDNYKTSHGVVYESRDLAEAAHEEARGKELDKL